MCVGNGHINIILDVVVFLHSRMARKKLFWIPVYLKIRHLVDQYFEDVKKRKAIYEHLMTSCL